MALAAVAPAGGAGATTTALPPVSTRTSLVRLVTPNRAWPSGGFDAEPGWFWGPQGRGATREPSWAPLLACVAGPAVVITPFALVELPSIEDESFGAVVTLMLCIMPGMWLGPFCAVLAVANETLGGLKADGLWDRFTLLGALCVGVAAAGYPLAAGYHPLNLGINIVASMTVMEAIVYLNAFDSRPPLRAFLTKIVLFFGVIAMVLFAVTVGFLLLSAETEDSGARLALSLGYTAVVWAIKRVAHVERGMWASTGSMAVSEVWVDSFTTLVMLSSVTLMEPLEFAVFLAVSLAAAAVVLWWPNIVDALAPRFAKGEPGFRQRRANTIAALNCVVNANTALGTLLLSFAFEGRHYFAIANYSDAQQTRLRQYMLVWAGAFVLLGCLLRFLRPTRHMRIWRDVWTMVDEMPIGYSSSTAAAYVVYALMTLEHMQAVWVAFPEDGWKS